MTCRDFKCKGWFSSGSLNILQLVVVPVLEKIQRLSFRVLFHCRIQELEIVKRLFKYTFGCSKMDIGIHQKKNHSQYYDNRFNDLRSGKRLFQLMAFLLFQKFNSIQFFIHTIQDIYISVHSRKIK